MSGREDLLEEIVIAPRFRGPPGSGNGGYVAGRLAAHVAGAASVRLFVPPPLDASLAVVRRGERAEAWQGELCVARAEPVTLDLAPPEPPSPDEARAAAGRYRGFVAHPFPTCFVCGPERAEGDGLRIFPGPLGTDGRVAAPWTPDASLDAGDGSVAPEFLWAALDCPGAFAFPQPEGAVVVLGELALRRNGEVRVGERCTVLAWPISHAGRKHLAGSALYDASGACRAVARATWIETSSAAQPRAERGEAERSRTVASESAPFRTRE